MTDAVASVLGQLSQLGPDQIHHYPDSNAWANGPAVAGGGALLGVYPGGQSENPASPWYTNLVPLWWDGKYLPVPEPGSAAGPAVWRLNG